MNAGKLDVFHYRGDESAGTIGNGVCFCFDGVTEEPVYENGSLWGDINGGGYVFAKHLLVVYHFHSASAEHIRRPDQQRVADASRDLVGLLGGTRGTPGRRRNLEFNASCHRYGGGSGEAVILDPRYYLPTSGGSSMYAKAWAWWWGNPDDEQAVVPPDQVQEAFGLYRQVPKWPRGERGGQRHGAPARHEVRDLPDG